MEVTVFIIFAIAFFAILIAIGAYTKKWATEAADFVISGREVGMIISTSGILAICFAGTSLSLVPSFSISYGLFGGMAWGGILAIGYAFYGLVFSKPVRRCGAQTLPEWMETRYDSKVRTITSIGTVLGLCGIMANNIASFATSLSTYINIPYWISISVCFLVIIIFTYSSGMWAVNVTNFFQMLIGSIALPLFAFIIASKLGFDFLSTNWPANTSWVSAGFTGQSLPIWTLKYPSVLTFIILNGCFLVWGSNYYYLRIVSCRTEKISECSFIAGAIVQIFVIYLPLAFLGLYAVGANPTTFAPVGKLPTVAAYGFMLFNLVAAVASFMLVASMAASISTASTALMGASSTAGRDIYQRNFRPNATAQEMLMPNKIIMVLLAAFTALLCFFPGGPTYLFAFANSWMGPPAVLFLFGFFWKRFTKAAAFWSVLAGMIVMSIFTVLDLTGIYHIGAIMHVGVVGLFVTLAVGLVVTFMTEPKYYAKSDWNINPSKGKRENIKLNSEEIKILELIRHGLTEMVEINDYLGVDSSIATDYVERLDRGGYIMRNGLTGGNFYVFNITEKGVSVLPALTDLEQELADQGLSEFNINYLVKVNKSAKDGAEYLKSNKISSLQSVAINAALSRYEYIGQKGVFRRAYFVTEKGKQSISKYASLFNA